MKFTGFTSQEPDSDNPEAQPVEPLSIDELNDENLAFIDVITDSSRNEERSSYTIKASFNPTLFDNTKVIVLSIPNTITTRSTLGKPNISDQTDNTLFEDNGGEE